VTTVLLNWVMLWNELVNEKRRHGNYSLHGSLADPLERPEWRGLGGAASLWSWLISHGQRSRDFPNLRKINGLSRSLAE
jgi:hypothetical protein